MDPEKLVALTEALGLTKEEALAMYERAAQEEQKRAEREQERAEREQKILELKLQLAEYASQGAVVQTGEASGSVSPRAPKICPKKLMAPFEEKRDDLDAYLQRFERIATGQGWEKSQWATALSLCLAGEALSVYGRMPASDSHDYDKVKIALLQRFRLTAEGFREKFRRSKPEDRETGRQFAARLSNYFDRWMELSETEKTYAAIRNRVVAEQFLNCCNPKLVVFLKEKRLHALDDLAESTDGFLEAQGVKNLGGTRDEMNPQPNPSANSLGPRNLRDGQHAPRKCYLCNRVGHLAADCRRSTGGGIITLTCQLCRKRGHKTEDCRFRQQDRAASIVCPEERTAAPQREDKKIKEEEAPVAIASSTTNSFDRMLVVEGELRGQKIAVLRDSGANAVLVRRSLVPDEDLTGEFSTIMLVDSTVRCVPEAVIEISTPYYSGKVSAKCLENPLYDLILGNVPGVRNVDSPDTQWFERAPVLEPSGVSEPRQEKEGSTHKGNIEAKTAAVKRSTRGEAEKPALKVPTIGPLQVTPSELAKQQEKDPSLQVCYRHVGAEWRRNRTVYEFQIRDGLLYRRCQFNPGREVIQLVVPQGLRHTVLGLAHDSIMAGHQGTSRTLARIAEEFFWPGMQSDTKRYVKSCDVCQRTFPKGRVGKAPLGLMPTIATPFHRVAIDIVGPITPASSDGNKYVLTLVDMATRYPEAVALKTVDTIQVAEALLEMFSRYGVPKEILSDRGSSFTSDLMREINRLMSIQQLLTTPYHPMANGLVEKFNGTLKNMIRKMCQENPKHWDRYLPALLFAYREVPRHVT